MAKFLKFSSSLAYRAGDSVLGQVNQTIDSAGIDRDFPIFLLSLVQRGGCQYPGDTLLPAVRQSVISQPDDLDYWLTYSGGTLQVVNTNTYQRIGAGQGLMGGAASAGTHPRCQGITVMYLHTVLEAYRRHRLSSG